MTATPTVLTVRGLTVTTRAGAPVVQDVDLALTAGRTLGLVGESGSGKSTVAMAVADLLPRGLRRTAGRIERPGASAADARRRGGIGVVFQHPATALNPRLSVGAQLFAAIGRTGSRRARLLRAVDLLDQVGVPRAAERLASYPHELSGGLAQRVVIATALAREPRVLVADEPTTALDVSVQATVLDLIDRIRAERDLAVLLISHDIGVIADRCDEVAVLRDGRVVQHGGTAEVLARPEPALAELVAARRRPTPEATPVAEGVAVAVDLRDVVCTFPRPGARRRDRLVAVDHVGVQVPAGGSLGIVGESGSGKTTLARVVAGLHAPDSGAVRVDGTDPGSPDRPRAWRRRVQVVFQDVTGTLDPRLTVAQTLTEALHPHGRPAPDAPDRVRSLLAEVGLGAGYADRYPGELSGGQRQRVGIARALAPDPAVLVADEPVSALDQTVQATVVDLLARIRRERGLTLLVVSHDFGVVHRLCDEVLVMQHGRVVERGAPARVLTDPTHPYTRALVDALPGRRLPEAETRHPAATPA